MTTVNMVRKGNSLRLYPIKDVFHIIADDMRFNKVTSLYGYERKMRGNVAIEPCELFKRISDEEVMTFAGLQQRLYSVLTANYVTCAIYDETPKKDVDPAIGAISDVQLRNSQLDIISYIMTHDYGQFNGITGMGKSFLITQICRMYDYPNYRIVVVAPTRPVVSSLYRSLYDYFGGKEVPGDKYSSHRPVLGKLGDGSKCEGRITVSTTKSLSSYADPAKADLVLYDEVHTAAADNISSTLLHFINAKMFGFSASTEARTDNANLLVEALFGPVLYTVTMSDGQREGYIPNVDAYFYEIFVNEVRRSDPTWRKREAIWQNYSRNTDVAKVARLWEQKLADEDGEEPQILVMTDTFEHVACLRKHLPDYEIIYGSIDGRKLKKLQKDGLIDKDFKKRSKKEHDQAIQAFERGDLKKVIATTTLGVGVDAPGLDVIIRADGGSSEISNIQFRGRITRGKRGIYCDFLSTGDDNERRRSQARMRSCKKAEWPVKVVPMGSL